MIIYRRDLEEREKRDLASYAMKSGDSRGRVHTEDPDAHRTQFQRDRDRIIHCSAFRRLEYKTQVFVNEVGDHYRTRLTHTIEVSQVGRSLARSLNLNEDLVEALALSHDLGHPPFGHSGEDELCALMSEHGGFEHNRQALRVVDQLEKRSPHWSGLNLTYEVRESILKHPTSYDETSTEEFGRGLRPLLEAQVTDIADSIAYNHHDLDDGLSSGMFTMEELEQVELLAEAMKAVRDRHGSLDRKVFRIRVIKYVINRLINDLIAESDRRITEAKIESPEQARGHPERLVRFSPELRPKVGQLEKFLHREFYRHFRVQRMRQRAKRIIRELFCVFVESPELLTPWYQAWAEKEGVPRAACDYVAGMTDRYAQGEFTKLFHPLERL